MEEISRENRELFMDINSLIFQGHETLLAGDKEKASEIYDRVTDMYKKLPHDLKTKVYVNAVDLKSRIKGCSKKKDSHNCFALYDGRLIKDLYHLIYALDTMDDLQWQCYVNAVKNDLHDWIRYKLKDKELAEMLAGITTKEDIKLIILRHILLKRMHN